MGTRGTIRGSSLRRAHRCAVGAPEAQNGWFNVEVVKQNTGPSGGSQPRRHLAARCGSVRGQDGALTTSEGVRAAPSTVLIPDTNQKRTGNL